MADNTLLNPGSGGDELRSLEDAGGVKWPTATIAYATTIGDGANVLQVVTPSEPLPVALGAAVDVEQADEAALNATAFQGGLWTVSLAGGTNVGITGTVAATQSGTWTVSLAPGTTVNLGSGAVIDLDPDAEIKLAAGTNLVGKVSAGVDAGTVYHGETAMEPRFAKIAANTAGNNAVVTAEVGFRIRVLRWGLTADGDVSVKWRSNSNDLTGERPLTKYASAGGAFSPVGIFETGGDESLFLTLSDNVAVGGELTYVLVPDIG